MKEGGKIGPLLTKYKLSDSVFIKQYFITESSSRYYHLFTIFLGINKARSGLNLVQFHPAIRTETIYCVKT